MFLEEIPGRTETTLSIIRSYMLAAFILFAVGNSLLFETDPGIALNTKLPLETGQILIMKKKNIVVNLLDALKKV
ncbi:hypothetical protein HZS_5362 [Henneguya salminicola]|nr:hypothetical protein HZS_5362 [Henneguya salminicola]